MLIEDPAFQQMFAYCFKRIRFNNKNKNKMNDTCKNMNKC